MKLRLKKKTMTMERRQPSNKEMRFDKNKSNQMTEKKNQNLMGSKIKTIKKLILHHISYINIVKGIVS